jgi:transcriptional regulator with XRE-family HTH domain
MNVVSFMQEEKERNAELIKQSRLAKGITQLELAERTNISLRSIQRIEKADVAARAYTLKVIAAALELDSNLLTAGLPADIAQAEQPGVTRNNTKKWIISIGTAGIMLLFGGAFLSQAPRFPETHFEIFLFWGMVSILYMIILLRIWK